LQGFGSYSTAALRSDAWCAEQASSSVVRRHSAYLRSGSVKVAGPDAVLSVIHVAAPSLVQRRYGRGVPT
jgi:hypothetical protein